MGEFNITVPQKAVNAVVDFNELLKELVYELEEILSGYEVKSVVYYPYRLVITLNDGEIILDKNSMIVRNVIDRRDYSEYR